MSLANQSKLNIMLSLQNTMNKVVHPDWINQEFGWYRAVWLETAEAVEHTDWKWWKKGEDNIEQIKLELVDIWHFILSIAIEEGREVSISNGDRDRVFGIIPALERVAAFALDDDFHQVNRWFINAMVAIDFSFDDLYKLYIAKNTLNLFRQANGYKTGGYIKIWGVKEDNEVLTELLHHLDSNDPEFPAMLYAELEAEYKTVKVG